jgi:hypothetical protein
MRFDRSLDPGAIEQNSLDFVALPSASNASQRTFLGRSGRHAPDMQCSRHAVV